MAALARGAVTSRARRARPAGRLARAWTLCVCAAVATPVAQEPVFRAGVEAVRLDISVTRGAAPVAGLTAANFEVRDNGVLQSIDRVSQEDVPLNLMLVLDASGSMEGGRLRGLVEAAKNLVASLRPGDRVGLLSFSQRLHLQAAPGAGHAAVRSALDGMEAAGPTALRDALFAGLQLVAPDGESRPVAVLFTDGRDTASWMGAGDLEGVVRRSGVILHAVELTGAPGGPGSAGDVRDARLRARTRGRATGMEASRSLNRAVEAGGGRVWSAASPDELTERFTDALDELRARYVVTYTPRGVAASGWHDLRVTLKSARGEVRARPGYFVPTAQ